MHRVILAVDQGTTGTTCLVVGDELEVVGRGYAPVGLTTPQPGLGRAGSPRALVERRGGRSGGAGGCGPARDGARRDRDREPARDDDRLGPRQRRAGAPGNRLAGPSHRGALPRAARRRRSGRARGSHPIRTSRRRSSSGSCAGRRATDGLAFGTVDSWLLWQLTGGDVHATDVSNASRTHAARSRDTRLERRAARPLRRAACAAAGCASVGDASSVRAGCSARRFLSRRSRATSRHRFTRTAAPRRPSAPAHSCSWKRAQTTRRRHTASCEQPRREPTGRTPSKVRSSSQAQRCNGSATGSACSRTPRRARRWRGRSTPPTVSTSCRRSPGSARRTGRPTPAD